MFQIGASNQRTDTGLVVLAQGGTVPSANVGTDFSRLSPQVRNPLLNVTNFYLPQDRKVLNQWIRYYDRFNPIVGNSLDLHSEICVSPFDLVGVDDSKVANVYKEMVFDELDLFNKFVEAIREFYLLGESFLFAQWNEKRGYFDQLVCVDPDYVHVHPHPFVHVKDATVFEIEPSEVLRDFVNSSDPVDMKLKQYLDPRVSAAIASGTLIKVSSFNMTGLIKRASPYDVRGTSIVLRALKYLMYEDKLIQAQYAIADGHVTPRWVFKLGDQAKGIAPLKKDLIAFRNMLMQGWYDYNFAIISSYALQVEAIGSTGKILPVRDELNFIEERILTALFTSKAATHGEGPTYANASVARMMANARYQNRRAMLEIYARKKLFEPVARAHKFYVPLTPAESSHGVRPSKRELLVPSINWLNKLDLSDTTDFRQYLARLLEKNQISMKTVCRIFGLDYAEEERALLRERGTVFDPVYQDYRKKHAEVVFEKKEKPARPGGTISEFPGGVEMVGGPEESEPELVPDLVD